jgi:hypothetical protein
MVRVRRRGIENEEPGAGAGTARPTRWVCLVSAVLLHRDESTWDLQVHPFLAPTIELERVDLEDPRDVTFKMPMRFSARNTEGVRITSIGIWGPSGYQPLRSEGEPEVQIIRMDEAPEPDPPEASTPG